MPHGRKLTFTTAGREPAPERVDYLLFDPACQSKISLPDGSPGAPAGLQRSTFESSSSSDNSVLKLLPSVGCKRSGRVR